MIDLTLTIVLTEELSANIFYNMFCDVPEVKIAVGDIRDYHADAIVSPANSFGIMDGGIDVVIRELIGVENERMIQRKIREGYEGELVIGDATIVPVPGQYKNTIVAPTMRIPTDVSTSINAYLAFRAAMIIAKKSALKTVVASSFCTGIGKMSSKLAVKQMRMAWDEVYHPVHRDFDEIYEFDAELRKV